MAVETEIEELARLMEGNESPYYRDPVTGEQNLDLRMVDYKPSPFEVDIGDGERLTRDPGIKPEWYPKSPPEVCEAQVIEDADLARTLLQLAAQDAGVNLDILLATAESPGRKSGFQWQLYDRLAASIHEYTRTNDPERDYALSSEAIADGVHLKVGTVERLKERGKEHADRLATAQIQALMLSNKKRIGPGVRNSEALTENPKHRKEMNL